MISERLLTVVRCPDCRAQLTWVGKELICQGCGRRYDTADDSFLDLRPTAAFAETTKYLDEALHADARHETVSPPLLSASIRNDMLRSFLAPTSADRVVDLGCGSGRALVWNQDFGAYLVGIDVSPHFAQQARAGVDLVIGDLRRLPIGDGAFTKAFSLDVAEHLSRESLVEMLREACRVLEPGGTLFLYTHVRKNSRLAVGLRLINWIAKCLDRIGLISLGQERLRKSDHLNPLADIDDFKRVASEAGFTLTRIRYYTPLVSGVVENLLVRLVEGVLTRRAATRLATIETAGGPSSGETGSIRAARLEAKARIGRRGLTYAALRVLTWFMKIDVLLFGRIESGPFFALLTKDRS